MYVFGYLHHTASSCHTFTHPRLTKLTENCNLNTNSSNTNIFTTSIQNPAPFIFIGLFTRSVTNITNQLSDTYEQQLVSEKIESIF
jgi:hypothetical protein